MARFSEESKQRVREAADLVELAGRYTDLRPAGRDRVVGLCPLHDERTASFTISPSKQLFHCFGCDAGGDVFSFVQLKESLDFPGALEFLARYVRVDLDQADEVRQVERARELVPLDRAAAFYAAHLRSPRSAEAREAVGYLASRGFGAKICEQFGLGFAPVDGTALLRAARAAGFSVKELADVGLTNHSRGGGGLRDRFRGRLMFPVCDMQGRVLGFGARRLDGERGPNYVNSPATSIFHKGELLYGAHHACAAAKRVEVHQDTVIVVEGYTDAVAMHQAGITGTVAVMGTAISEHQIAALKHVAPTVVLMFDGDEAGTEAGLRAGEVARSSALKVLVAPLPPGSDPAELLRRDGPDALRGFIAGARAAPPANRSRDSGSPG